MSERGEASKRMTSYNAPVRQGLAITIPPQPGQDVEKRVKSGERREESRERREERGK